jgi:hypothetical protein
LVPLAPAVYLFPTLWSWSWSLFLFKQRAIKRNWTEG